MFSEHTPHDNSQTSIILRMDALSLSEEISNIRKGGSARSNLSNADKVIIHLRYLLTSRFEESYEFVLKLISTFIELVGDRLKEAGNLLQAVSELKINKGIYE